MNLIKLVIAVVLSNFAPIHSLPGIVETVAGSGPAHTGKKSDCNNIENSQDGYDTEARFNYPWGIAYDPNNHVVYVADCGCMNSEHRTDKIRKVNLQTGLVTTIAGSTQGYADGFGNEAHFHHIAGITLDPQLEMLYIADSGNNRIRVLYLATNKVETIAGLPSAGLVDQSTISSMFSNPQSVVVYRTDNAERLLYVADTDNHAIRVVHLSADHSGYVKTLAGGVKGFSDGLKLSAKFNQPVDVVIDGIGTYMYIADHLNHAIRRLELATGYVTTLGEDGFDHITGTNKKQMTFHYPDGLVFDPDFHLLYVCEFANHDIRVITRDGVVRTLAGEFRGYKDGVGKVARFYHPTGLAFDRKTRLLYVADQYNHLVRRVSAFGSNVTYEPDAYNRRRELRRIRIENYKRKKVASFPWMFFTACGFAFVLFAVLIIKPVYKYLVIYISKQPLFQSKFT